MRFSSKNDGGAHHCHLFFAHLKSNKAPVIAYFSFFVCQEEKAKAYKKEKQKERKRRAEEDVDFEEDDEMAAVMGFSGFGSSKKSH